MKKLITLSLCLFSVLSYSQRVMIEAGPTFFKDYAVGINAGITGIIAKTATSGVGIGAEVYKSADLPIGFPIFVRGVMVAKSGLILNLSAGYMIMNEEYDDGKLNYGGLYSKLGVGYATKHIYGLFQFNGATILKEFKPGISLSIGARF